RKRLFLFSVSRRPSPLAPLPTVEGKSEFMKKIVESYKRKLAAEEGWVLKRGAQLRIALCYPNVYSIGMANLGFQAMYEIFNNIPDVSCERVFLPDSVRSVRVGEASVSTRTL